MVNLKSHFKVSVSHVIVITVEDPCFSSRREFIPITVIDQARQKGSSLKEKVDEWRKNGGACDLETHLQSSVVRPTARRASLRTIEANDVASMKTLGVGSAATVYEV